MFRCVPCNVRYGLMVAFFVNLDFVVVVLYEFFVVVVAFFSFSFFFFFLSFLHFLKHDVS